MPSIRESCPEKVDEIIRRFPQKKSATIPLLYLAWEVYGYISREAMVEIAEILGLSPAYIQGIASFYTMFPLQPQGKHHIEVCTNISCHLVGAPEILKTVQDKTGLAPGERSEDGRYSVQPVECLACCSWGPCMHVNGKEYKNLTPEKVEEILSSLS